MGQSQGEAAYDYMKSYGPYDNIEKKNYPAVLVTTSFNDSQVMYWEPASTWPSCVSPRRIQTRCCSNARWIRLATAAHPAAMIVLRTGTEMAWMLGQVGIKK